MYLKLTAIKDMPEVESGFSWTFMVDKDRLLPVIPENFDRWKMEDKVDALRYYHKFPEFVKTEPDCERANKELLCPVCKEHTLFPYNEEEHYKYEILMRVGLECGKCGKKIGIMKTYVRKY